MLVNHFFSIFSCTHCTISVLNKYINLTHSAAEEDHHRVIAAALRPPTDWRRRVERPRTTWLRTIDEDVQPQNFGYHTAWRKARDRVYLAANRSYGSAVVGARHSEEEVIQIMLWRQLGEHLVCKKARLFQQLPKGFGRHDLICSILGEKVENLSVVFDSAATVCIGSPFWIQPNVEALQDMTDRLHLFGKKVGLCISGEKTKAMTVGNQTSPPITLEGQNIEKVDKLQYLGSYLSENGDVEVDIRARLGKASSVFQRLQPIGKCSTIQNDVKLRLYSSIVIPKWWHDLNKWHYTTQ